MPAGVGPTTGGPGGPPNPVSAVSTLLQVGLVLTVVGFLVAVAVLTGGSEPVAAVQEALGTIERFWGQYAAPPATV